MARYQGGGVGWFMAAAGMVSVAAPSAQAQAQAQENVVNFAIGAGPASRTVREFARLAGLTVLATTEDLAGITTNPVNGSLRPGEALARLLANSGLVAHARDNGSVLIVRAPGAAALAPVGRSLASASQALPAAHSHAEPPDEDADEVPKVLVAVRRAQQSSIERKKNAGTAMDAIVADDVGTLPDRNIGEALSRIAGVAIERGDFGEGVSVSIRGNGSQSTRV